MNIGDKIIGEIVKQGMFRVSFPDPDESHVFVWSSGAAEQLDALVAEHTHKLRGALLLADAAFAAGQFGAECRSAAAAGLLKSIGDVIVCDADGGFTDDEDEGFVLTDAGLKLLAEDYHRRQAAYAAALANAQTQPRDHDAK